MSNWKRLNLGKLGKSYSGLNGKTKQDFGKGSPYIPYLRIFEDGKIDLSRLDYVSIDKYERQNCVQLGDLFFTTSSETINEVGMTSVLIDKPKEKTYLNSFCFGFRLSNFDELTPEYARYLFRSIKVRKDISLLGQGSTRYNLPKTILFKKLFIDVPDIKYQQKIAKILNTIDTVIEKTELAIAKYQAIKKGMMHDLFTRGIDVKTGKLRPSFDDAPELYKESVLGMIPKDWTLSKLIDSASTEHYGFTGGPFGSDLQTKDYTDTGVQVIQLQNIGDGEFINKSIVYTSTKKADELKSCNIYPGDIILAKMAYPVARACIIPNHAERFIMASDGIRLKVDSFNYNTLFVKESINNKYFRTQAIAKSTGTTRERIGLTELKNIKVKYPKFEEQNAIAKRIESIDSLIIKEQKTLAKNQKIKKGLMQDLLTGKVEVTV